MLNFRGLKEVLSASKFPKSNEVSFSKNKSLLFGFKSVYKWISKMSEYLTERRRKNASAISKISAQDAAKLISQSGYSNNAVPFDSDEASRLKLNQGDIVSVVPVDNARNYPTVGKLIGLDREEFVLQVSGKAVKSLRCHFPRLNFSVKTLPQVVGSKL